MIRHCKVCGAKYDTCLSCEKERSWRIHTDIADHYYLLCVLMDYRSDHDTKKAYAALVRRGIDPHDYGGFLPEIQRLMADIVSGATDKKSTENTGIMCVEFG